MDVDCAGSVEQSGLHSGIFYLEKMVADLYSCTNDSKWFNLNVAEDMSCCECGVLFSTSSSSGEWIREREADEAEEGQNAMASRNPGAPSKEELRIHSLTHVPFKTVVPGVRPW